MTFSSVYEMFDPLTTVRKQHFWDWFSGDDIRSIWTKTDIAGTGTFAMNDSVDGGYGIAVTGVNNNSHVGFNNKRQYNFDNTECILVLQRVTTNDGTCIGGLISDAANPLAGSTHHASYEDRSTSTNKGVRTGDGSTNSGTEGSVAVDQNFTTSKLILSASDVKLYVSGVLDITKTTNLPTVKLQPYFGAQGLTSASGEKSNCRYYEVYNT